VTAPHVFSELGATVIPIGVKPNGKNINLDRGAMHPEHCAKEVLRSHAHVGFALDGDADRVVVVDEKGRQINGDAVMALCATRMIKRGVLKKKTLVATVMSGIGLDHSMSRCAGKLVRVDVGDRYVVEAMRKKGFNFGGEQSGHLIFLDHSSTGDGTLGALQLLAIMLREGRPLSELVDEVFEAVPQVLVNVPLPARKPLVEMIKTTKVIQNAEKSLGEAGRVLVRWSGTEPKLRVMVEGPNENAIRNLANSIAQAATAELR
jgi:phosphoglucosamine mutase